MLLVQGVVLACKLASAGALKFGLGECYGVARFIGFACQISLEVSS